MKKHRISKRIFAMLLVICMVFTMMPANTYLADELAGTITDAGMDLAADATLSSTDTIKWPIEIYDYENDGMLFEFASASGNTENFNLLDDSGEYVYMPDMDTDYYVDYTKEEVVDSYVVKNWFPAWKNTTAFQDKMGNLSYPLRYYRMDEVLHDNGGTELIDFRDPNADGLLECYGATKDASGKYTFANVSGYIFKMNGENTAVVGNNTLVTDQSLYGSSNPNWAVSVLLRPTGVENQYSVVAREENPGEGTHTVASVFKDITVESTDIVMIAHSTGSGYGHDNWMDKVAANALKEGDLVTKIVSGSDVSIKVNPVDGVDASQMKTVNKDKVKYAVLVYRTYDLQVDLQLKLMLRAADGTKYFGSAKTIAAAGDATQSDWAYCVLDLSTFTKDTSTSTTTYTLANNWNIVNSDIQSAGIHLLETDDTADGTDGYWFDVSHFAMFSSEGEATAYGEKALVNNNHYIYHYADEITYPNISETYGDICADYTQASIADSRVISYWPEVWSTTDSDVTYTQTCDDIYGSRYYKFSQIPAYGLELIDFTDINGHLERDKAKYAVLCFKLQGLGSGGYADIRAFVRGDSHDKDFSPRVGNTMTWCGDGWQYLIFDITAAAESSTFTSDTDEKVSEKIQSAGIAINAYHGTATTDSSGNTTYSYALDTTFDLTVSHFAVFETSEEANAFVDDVKDYHTNYVAKTAYYNPIYHNIAYGFLNNSSTNSELYPNKLTAPLGYGHYGTTDWGVYTEESDGIFYIGHNGTDISMEDYNFVGYDLFGTVTSGAMTAGLLEAGLEKGNPVYREKVVDYLAELLYTTLGIPEYKNGRFNYDFLRGKARAEYALEQGGEAVDLATAIRNRVGVDFEKNLLVPNMGNYTDTATKAEKGQLSGKWENCKQYISTCYDAAYYLLNNLFVEGSYNMPQDTFDYLELNKTKDSDGNEAYIFDGGFSIDMGYGSYGYAVDYNIANKIISFKKDSKTGEVLANSKAIYYQTSTNPTTLCPFLPVKEADGTQIQTESPYFADDGVSYDGTYGATYSDRNYNYVMKSNAEFVYHEDDGLFFEFEGDDDVYLFINGQLVLDIGGCHGITKYRVDINEYVANAQAKIQAGSKDPRDVALALEEGGVYSFDFFYMERHGFGANCRIFTNMRVSDPAMHVEKTAYQSGEEVNYGGIVVENELVEYQFSLTNTGNTKLYNISFDDPAIGVRIDSEKGLTVSKDETVVCGSDKSPLDYADLTAVVTGYKAVDDGTGNYKEENGVMVEVAVGEGTHIFTENEIKFADNNAVKDFMATLKGDGLEQDGSDTNETGSGGGLWVNSTLVIKGIYYKWQDKDETFSNTVYVEATDTEDGTDRLRSQASHKTFVPSDPFYYQWSGHEIIITPDTLVADILANAKTEDDPFYDTVNIGSLVNGKSVTDIIETSYTGNPITTQTVTIDDAHNVTVKYDAVGTHVFYLKVSYGGNLEVKVPVVVHVTDVENSYMVLDYGLAVDLTQDDEIFKYDTITVPGRDTDTHLMAITGTQPEYNASYGGTTGNHRVTVEGAANTIEEAGGTFTLNGSEHEFTLTYNPTAFMEDMDTIWAAVAVHDEENADFEPKGLNEAIDIRHEVQMFKEIGVLPANVVYYEDDFPAITYTNVGNSFEQVDSSDDGTHQGSSGLYQSPDQEQEYGKDSSAYGTNAEMSGNSITKITINDNSQVASFTFKGTGFELISRTNAYDSAKITVIVEDKDDNRIKVIPVITEFDHNGDDGEEEIYQVPVIRVDDLAYGTYTVKISGIPTRDYTKNAEGKYLDPTTDYTELTSKDTDDAGKYPYVVPTILYIDGLRIFNPMEAEETEEYYNESENGAVFKEIRDLIVNAQAAVAEYYYDSEESRVSYGTVTWTENRNNSTSDGNLYIGKQVSSVDDYLAFGPNNEVYMAKDDNKDAALVFYVQENRAGANLQIAARAIDNELFMNGVSTTASAELEYAVMQDGNIVWKPLATITGATEQYYTIDYSECPYIVDKGFQIAIKVTEGMVSYSSLKCNGLDINQMSSEFESTTLKYENGILVDAETGEETDTAAVPAFPVLKDTLESEFTYTSARDTNPDNYILYQTRNGSDLRLISYVKDLKSYSDVAFTLTINGRETKELVCTFAYTGLYADGAICSTEQIYGVEGYFVTYTINGYLDVYAGEEVTITAKYTDENGDLVTKARTVTIGSKTNEQP